MTLWMKMRRMRKVQINIKRLNSEAKIPTKAHTVDAGFDLYCSIKDTFGTSIFLWPEDGPVIIPTNISMQIPEGYFGLICDRSSFGSKGIKVFGGVIDSGYLGDIKVCLCNVGNEGFRISHGDRIAQLLILPVPNVHFIEVDSLGETDRGDKGFGSSNVN